MPDGGAARTVAEALLAELARRGTRRIWGVPGGGSALDLLAAMECFGIRFVLARHEGAAAMGALAEAELTGAPGVVLTTLGPGVGNALNGLACASLERAPVLLVSDGFTQGQLGWVTHQLFDQRAASAPFVAGYARAEGARPAAEIAALLDLAQRERRAVHLDLTGEADLIVTAGLDPVELIPQPWRYRAPVLEVTRRPHPVRYVEPEATLHGPLPASLQRLSTAARRSDWGATEIARHRDAALAALAWAGQEGISPPDVVRIAQEEARAAGRAPRVSVDAGAHMFSATAFWQCDEPRDLLISNGLSSMGFALPAGIAAALHDPARGAIAFTGDGGLMMVAGELATAAEARARLVTVVFNDGALSLIDIKQQQRQLPPEGVRWRRPDFAKVAEGFGVRGFVATDADAFRAALRAAFAHDGPSLVDVHVDPSGYPAQIQALRG